MTNNLNQIITRLDYIEKGIVKTEIELNRRLEGMNEFRAALKDQSASFITRDQVDQRITALNEKIDAQQKLIYIGIGAVLIIELLILTVY